MCVAPENNKLQEHIAYAVTAALAMHPWTAASKSPIESTCLVHLQIHESQVRRAQCTSSAPVLSSARRRSCNLCTCSCPTCNTA